MSETQIKAPVFRAYVRKALSKKDKTQEEMADDLGITKAAISAWYRTGSVSRDNLVQAATYLERPVEELQAALKGDMKIEDVDVVLESDAKRYSQSEVVNALSWVFKDGSNYKDRIEIPKGMKWNQLIDFLKTNSPERNRFVHLGGYSFEQPAESDPYQYASRVRGLKLSAGSGHLSWEHEEVDRSHAFRKSWLEARGVLDVSDLKIMDIEGMSMWPKLEDGMVVAIHLKDRTVRSDKIYAIDVDGETRIKRLYKRADGSIEIRSDNPDKVRYPTEVLDVEQANRLAIIGRMIWYSGED